MGQLLKVKITYFLLGIGASLGLLLLTAASNSPPTLNYGRYQISSWAGKLGDNGGAVGAFVVDTATGETKTVYSRVYGEVGGSKIERNNLKIPFASMD